MDVERLSLKGRKAVSDRTEDGAHLVEMVEALVKPEILETVAECL